MAPDVVAAHGPAAPARPPAWRSFVSAQEPILFGLLGLFAVGALWEIAARLDWVRPILISSPSQIFEVAVREFSSGRIWADLWVSFVEYSVGLLLALVIGVAIGIVAGWSERAGAIVNPWLTALYVTPIVALVPIFILWFGIGIEMKVFVVFLLALFPIAINTIAGVRAAEHRFVRVARSFGASNTRLFTTVVFPGTVPFIFTGVRQASGRALVGVVVAELIASNQGIGFMMSLAGSTFNTPKVMLGIIILALFGVFVGLVLQRIERRFEGWRPEAAP
jgi:NitT/TauT family transport system permease protein